uniref:Secreted protein n=1 Tax=Brassica oleracea var. oleracea TaxID=109376 RepID=A0A0D3BEC4_BRAOL
MDSNSFCLLLCFLLRPTGSINGNLIFPRRPVASAGTKGSPALVSLFSFFCHCVHLVPLRYPQGFGIGFGHQEPSAAEEMRLRRFICFLWCFNEQGVIRFFSDGGSHYHGGESCSLSSQVGWSSISVPARVGDSLRLGLCPGSSYCLYTRRVLAARVFVCLFSTTSGFVAAIAAWSSLTSQHHLSLLELSVGVCDKLCADSGFQAKEYGGYGSFLARRDLGTCSFRV